MGAGPGDSEPRPTGICRPACESDPARVEDQLTDLELWPEESLEAIHDASLQLLERAGLRVLSGEVRAVLLAAGCLPGAGDRILVPRRIVEEALGTCPASFTMVARDPGRDLLMDATPGPIYVHNMGGAVDVVDPRTGLGHRATFRDQVEFSRLLHHMPNVDCVIAVTLPHDVPDELEPLYSFLAVASETDKCVGGMGISFPFQERYLREMSIALTGADGSGGRYPSDVAFSPVSPLTLGDDVNDALVQAARSRAVSIGILPAPAAGTTAPGSLAGALAQQNAEVLGGVVLVQAVAPGVPVSYAPRLSAIDPRTGRASAGTPAMALASAAAVLLARRYGLACDCFGPTSDGRVADAQYGWEHAFNTHLVMQARPRFVSGVGDMQVGLASALEGVVMDDEIVGIARDALRPRSWDAGALDIDEMVAGALSGSFLSSKATRRHLRSDYRRSTLGFGGGREEWEATGRASVVDEARERVQEALAHEPVGLPEDILSEMCRLIDACAREVGLAEWPDPRRLLEQTAGVA